MTAISGGVFIIFLKEGNRPSIFQAKKMQFLPSYSFMHYLSGGAISFQCLKEREPLSAGMYNTGIILVLFSGMILYSAPKKVGKIRKIPV